MNIEALNKVRDWLLVGAPERKFDMSQYFSIKPKATNWCGTSCCIAGYVYSTMVPFEDRTPDRQGHIANPINRIAAERLGLDKHLANALFFPNYGQWGAKNVDFETITPQQAAEAIQNVITQGHPRWDLILAEL